MPVPVRQAPSGTWLVDEVAIQSPGCVVTYCRVSSADQKADLERQAARIVSGANGLGLAVAEVGSGLSGRRLVVLDSTGTADDLVRDITEGLTSLCARRYGRRAARSRSCSRGGRTGQ